ncbi:MAG: tRNA-dihydrouridine synthase family protein [Candidatus Magasanikbacteria bacterium]
MTWIENKPIIALAPMADYTDQPFSILCREVQELRKKEKGIHKEFIIFREMVSAEAIVRGNEKTLNMCKFEEIERSIVLQLFGSKPEVIVEAARIITEKFFNPKMESFERPFSPLRSARDEFGVDINMGCPVPKIAGKADSGAALMKDHNRAVEIVKALKNANLGVPISVKTRLGWSKEGEILEFAQKLEQAGVDALSIHGRTKVQGYSGKANWEMIGEAKKCVKIPVIANGDITSPEDIERCLETTGADGVMIGRGALGNPWLLSSIANHRSLISLQERKDVILRHAQLQIQHYGERGIVGLRKHLAFYFKGLEGMKEIRSKLVRVNTIEEIEEIVEEI